MILAIDVGNTSIHCGLFRQGKLIRESRWATDQLSEHQNIRKWIPEKEQIRKTVICSVVPKVSRRLKKWFPQALFVDHRNAGVKVKLSKPSEVGTDRLVNARAATQLYGGPAILIDFGTATTFDVINTRGEYLGGAIAPGLLLARDALHFKTAQLPQIKLQAPRRVIGKSTVEALESGLVFGYVALVEGLIARIKKAVGTEEKKIKVIATGGLSPLICQKTDVIDRIDQVLTLKGLRLIGENNE